MTFNSPDMTIGRCVRTHALAAGSSPAFLTASRTVSWKGYDEATDRISANLAALGVERGDRAT